MFGFRLREAVDGEEERVGGLRGVGLQVARDEDVEVGFAVDGGVEGFVFLGTGTGTGTPWRGRGEELDSDPAGVGPVFWVGFVGFEG